jgi:DNA-repair protein XRCC3
VLDSNAALFRAAQFESLAERSKVIFELGAAIKALAAQKVLVLVINQVSDYAEESANLFRSFTPRLKLQDLPNGLQSVYSSRRHVVPALGISWAHCVNLRIMLARELRNGSVSKRLMYIATAPHLPQKEIEFTIDGAGIAGVDLG